MCSIIRVKSYPIYLNLYTFLKISQNVMRRYWILKQKYYESQVYCYYFLKFSDQLKNLSACLYGCFGIIVISQDVLPFFHKFIKCRNQFLHNRNPNCPIVIALYNIVGYYIFSCNLEINLK